MKAVIIDDEEHNLATLEILIDRYCPQVTIVGLSNNAARGIKLIDKLQPDLVFLDISMPKMNGFELLNHVKHQQFELIFTTAHDRYALKAFEVGATHYLLKPIGVNELKKAVERVEKKWKDNAANIQIAATPTNSTQTRIAVPSLKGLEMLEVDSIIRCEADSNYTTIHMVSDKIVVTKTLKELERILQPNNFARIHHSHLINLTHLKTYLKGDGGVVILTDGQELSVSRSRKKELLEKIQSL